MAKRVFTRGIANLQRILYIFRNCAERTRCAQYIKRNVTNVDFDTFPLA